MGDITIDEKLNHLEAELKAVQKIREEIFSKVEELELSDAKMIALSVSPNLILYLCLS